jgi:hypothetical protein
MIGSWHLNLGAGLQMDPVVLEKRSSFHTGRELAIPGR